MQHQRDPVFVSDDGTKAVLKCARRGRYVVIPLFGVTIADAADMATSTRGLPGGSRMDRPKLALTLLAG
jgi:hypothetical protein